MAEAITFSTAQLVFGVLGFGLTVAGVLLSGALWLDRKRNEGDRVLHQRVDGVVVETQAVRAAAAKIREEFVPKADFQRHQDRIDDELRGLRQDIKGEFGRLNDRFDRLLADRRAAVHPDHGDD